MDKMVIKIIEILLANPLTVTLVLSGVICVIIAIIGQIPKIEGQISGVRAAILGSFGVLLIATAVFLAWISALSVSQDSESATASNSASVELPPTNTPVVSISPEQPIEMQISGDCPKGERLLPDRIPVVGEPWTLRSGGWIIVNFWSNEPGIDQTEHKLLLGPHDPRVFFGGGSAWWWPEECEGDARANFQDNPNPPTSLEQLEAQNLVVR